MAAGGANEVLLDAKLRLHSWLPLPPPVAGAGSRGKLESLWDRGATAGPYPQSPSRIQPRLIELVAVQLQIRVFLCLFLEDL